MPFLRRQGKQKTANNETGRSRTVDGVRRKDGAGKKSRSLQLHDAKPFSGVFVSERTLTTLTPPTSLASVLSSSSCTSSESQESALIHWKSSGAKGHHRNSPLIAPDPDRLDDTDNNDNSNNTNIDEAQRLGMAMARSRHLPDTWYYSSNHILVNQERAKRTVAPLTRMRGLDEIARFHAQQMATTNKLHHLDLESLRHALKDLNCRRVGANVQRGESIRSIHDVMMNALSNKNNILDRRFTHMGMGTALGQDGQLYLCQIFRG